MTLALRTVGKLIERLSHYDPETPVFVSMWYGPGSPEGQAYPVEEVRYVGQRQVWIGAVDVDRTAIGVRTTDEARVFAARDLRRAAEGLRDLAESLETSNEPKETDR